MKRIFRFSIAVLLAGLLMTLAAGVWAAGKEIAGTVPNGTTCSARKYAIFTESTSDSASCRPARKEPRQTTRALYSRIYQVDAGHQYVCFAYPPAFARHNVGIYVYSAGSWQSVLSEIVGNPAQICATLPVGSTFALMGNK